MKTAVRACTALILALAYPLLAAGPRETWLLAEIYRFNHTFAVRQPAEIETKMQKMAESPFTFYRGTAHVFYQDMRSLPASAYSNSATNRVWLTGDAHLQNTGAFKDSTDSVVFDSNDFDEAYLGPYTWDLRRMAVGLQLAAKQAGLGSVDRRDVVRAFLDGYLNKMEEFSGNDSEKTYRLSASNTSGTIKDMIEASKAATRSEFLSKYTTTSGGSRKFATNSERVRVSASAMTSIQSMMPAYINSIPVSKRYATSYYAVKDIVQKFGSGIGSLGRARYWILIEGPSTSSSDDRVLEMKEQAASSAAIALPGNLAASYYQNNEGMRAAVAQKALLCNADWHLGAAFYSALPFLIREKNPYAVDFDTAQLTSKSKFLTAADLIGKTLAHNHAVADKDYDSTLVAAGLDREIVNLTSGSKGLFKDEISAFAAEYAAQVEYDFASFVAARQRGTALY